MDDRTARNLKVGERVVFDGSLHGEVADIRHDPWEGLDVTFVFDDGSVGDLTCLPALDFEDPNAGDPDAL
jgi:hypothetical protein